MPLTFQFPEGPMLRRLAASLATPASRVGGSSLSQRTYAFFLVFPWTGRRDTPARHGLDLKSSCVGQWFSDFPWNGVLLVPGQEGLLMAPPTPLAVEPAATDERANDTASFFDAFFADDNP